MPTDSTLSFFTELLVYGKQKIKSSCIIYPEGHIRLVHIRRRRVISCHGLYSPRTVSWKQPLCPQNLRPSIQVLM